MSQTPLLPDQPATKLSHRPVDERGLSPSGSNQQRELLWAKAFESAIRRLRLVCHVVLEFLRSHCPGTAQNRRAYRKRIVAAAQKSRLRLLELDEMKFNGNKAFRTRLRHYLNQVAAIGVWEATVSIVAFIAVLVWIAILLVTRSRFEVSPRPTRHSEVSRSLEVATAIVLLGFVILFILLSVFESRVKRMPEYLRSFPHWGRLLLLTIVISFLCFVIPILPSVEKGDVFKSLPDLIEAAGIITLPIIFTAVTVVLVCRRRRNSICTDAIVADNLFQILTLVRSHSDWCDLAKRSQLLKLIEEAATCIEFGLPRRLKVGDPVSNLWLQQRVLRISAALRELKMWIAMPKVDTRAMLIERVKADLVSVVLGNWDRLPESEPKKLSLRVRTLTLVRDVLLAVLPLCAALLLHKWNPTNLEPTAMTWLFTACFAWFVYRLTAIVDPRLVTTGAFRSFLELIPWPKSKG